MTKIIWEQAAILLIRNRNAFVLAVFFACQSRLLAAPDLSDMLATRVCWLRPPYALSKCYSRSGEPYHAYLCLGWPSQSGDMRDYDGIGHVQPVAFNISRVAVTSRYIIIEYAGSEPSFGVIDTRISVREPVQLESWAELRQYLEQGGENSEAIRFQDFEEIYRERSSWWRVYKTELAALFFLVLVLGFVMAWRHRRKRALAFWGRRLGMVLPFLLAFLLDWSLTLYGQTAEYWAGNYACANETSPFFRGLFMIHPLAAIAGQLVWVGLILELLVLLPEFLAMILFILVVFGHMMGAYSWMILDITVGTYQFGMVTNLATALLLGLGLHWSQRAPLQNGTSEGTLPTWLRYGLIPLLSGTALLIVFAPW